MRRSRAAIALVACAGLLLSACGDDAGAICPAIAPFNGVSVRIDNAQDAETNADRLRLCVDGRCSSHRPANGVEGIAQDVAEPSEREVEVDVSIVSEAGRDLATDTTTASLVRTEPYGEDCHSEYRVSLIFDAARATLDE